METPLKSNRPDQASVGESTLDPHGYQCHLAVISEDDGGVSVLVLNLPGCGSCGDTEEEALDNVREAVAGVIESYRADQIEIPWSVAYDIPDAARLTWISVHA